MGRVWGRVTDHISVALSGVIPGLRKGTVQSFSEMAKDGY